MTVRKGLRKLALASIIFIFLMDLWLKNIPAPNEFFYICGNFFYGLSTAYIASFVFYFIDVHYKRQREKELLYGYIGHYFKLIIEDGKSIFTDMANSIGYPVKFESITPKDVITICSKINPKANSTIKLWNNDSYVNWIEYLEYKRKRMIDFLSKIQLQLTEPEFIKIIIEISDSDIFAGLNIMLSLNKHNQLENTSFGNGLEDGFIQYMELIKTSERYYKKEFSKYINESQQ